jgi:hypothetical protein
MQQETPQDRPPHVPPLPARQPAHDLATARRALGGSALAGIALWLLWSIIAQLASATLAGASGTLTALHGWCSQSGSNLGQIGAAGTERGCSLIGDVFTLAGVAFWLAIAAAVGAGAITVVMLYQRTRPGQP